MSNEVQSHEELAERAAGERRVGVRHAARSLGSVTARIIGGSQVDLVNFSSRGVLFECDSRLLIGARASVRITTPDANLIVTGRVVRSRVKGLVNGALRYDAALVLDNELALASAILADAAPAALDEELVAFESDFDPGFDPSPVEAYLAESEASLLEVAQDDPPLNLAAIDDQTSLGAEAAPVVAADLPEPVDAGPVEPADEAEVASASADFGSEPVALDADPVAFEAEPIAFEPDGEIAFEPAVEFAFDESGDAPMAAEEPAGTSMFDATYIAPVYEPVATESQFDVTPPTPVSAAAASSFFDPQPSETYGEAPADPVVAAAAETAVAALDAPDGIDFESEVAFEAADVPVFEPAFESSFEPALEPSFEPALEASLDEGATDVPTTAGDLVRGDVLEASTPEAASDADLEPPAAPHESGDRVLLQFAATVPHDLAELRRIAADNQW